MVVTPNLRADDCEKALRQVASAEIVMAESPRQATTLLRSDSYLAVVLDQYLLETEREETETMMRHLGTAIPLEINLAITGMDRLAREVQAAVQRRKHEEEAARRAAVTALRSELNGTVTALLLSFELVLGAPGLPSGASSKLQSAHELVEKLRSLLESGTL